MKFFKKSFETYTQNKEQVYIVPTKAGFKFIFINFTLFLISLSYANNMALLITFIMVSYLILQMLETHKIILETKVDGVKIPDNFFDSQNEIITHFKNKLSNTTTKFIQLQVQMNNDEHINTEALLIEDENLTKHKLTVTKRGSYKPKRVKLFTFGRSKLFYVWRYFPVETEFYIYPKREKTPTPKQNSDSNSKSVPAEVEFTEHIPYTHGLNSKRIDWKVYARKDVLYWKKHTDHQSIVIDINFNKLEGKKEIKLQRMSYLIEQMFKNGLSWKLSLPTKILKTSHGFNHYKKSLEAISEY